MKREKHSRLLVFVAILVCLSYGLYFSPKCHAYCFVDSPDCTSCFIDDGAWDPAGNLLDVAAQTVNTAESCVTDGGKPFYQIQAGYNSAVEAQSVAPILGIFGNRSAWCSETVGYWHREANIPSPLGGYVAPWHLSWRTTNVKALRRWYKTAEAFGFWGRWIDSTELNLNNLQPGVNAPCPGAYQQLEGYIPEPQFWPYVHWAGSGNAHSQVVNRMWVFHRPDGKIIDIDIEAIEGNADNRVQIQSAEDRIVSMPRYTPDGGLTPDDFLGDNRDRKIRGWGIDLDGNGDPMCHLDSEHMMYVEVDKTFVYGHLHPYSVIDTDDEIRVEENLHFSFAVARQGGALVTINGDVPQPKPLPMPDQPWVIRRVVDADENPWIEMTIEYPLPMPYAVGELELEFGQGSAIPEMIKVWAEGPKLCPDSSDNCRAQKANGMVRVVEGITRVPIFFDHRKNIVAQIFRVRLKLSPKGQDNPHKATAISAIHFHPFNDPTED